MAGAAPIVDLSGAAWPEGIMKGLRIFAMLAALAIAGSTFGMAQDRDHDWKRDRDHDKKVWQNNQKDRQHEWREEQRREAERDRQYRYRTYPNGAYYPNGNYRTYPTYPATNYPNGYGYGYPTTNYPNGYGYPNRGYGNYGYGNYAGQAQSIGYQDGYQQGLGDRNNGHSFRPTQHGYYSDGSHGYSSSMGVNKSQYAASYRQAYMQGYQAGYNGGGRGGYGGWPRR